MKAPLSEGTMSNTDAPTASRSAFGDGGFAASLKRLIAEVQKIYLSDQIPWVVGYSGGKDSTATLQLVWMALSDLPAKKRFKPVHVITTDTLVENPIVAAWVNQSLDSIEEAACAAELPIYPSKLTPDVRDTFWVNLIGRGYPAPRPKFRWCTERMKIKPADAFIKNVVQQNGEAIVVLGTRRAESTVRAGRMKAAEARQSRDHLHPHSSLTNAYICCPISDWSNDDVWLFLMQCKNPWNYSNKDLLTLYQGASADGECPLVIDTSTPSCGDSRFGCWVCTMVSKDRSMSAMIQNDAEKEWMEPLLLLRNELDEHDHDKRDFRRMGGNVQLFRDREEAIPGPYTQNAREHWLTRLLEAQTAVRENPMTPESVRDIELISMAELHQIRRIWVLEKYEVEDRLPEIYAKQVGQAFPAEPLNDLQPFKADEMEILKEICEGDDLHFELVRELLEVERSYRGMARRSNLFSRIDQAFKRNFYEDRDDATARAARRKQLDTLVTDLKESELDFFEAVGQISREVSDPTPTKPNETGAHR